MDILESVIKLRDATQPPHFAVFDFDGTMIVNDSAEAVLAYMARHPHDYPDAPRDFEKYHSMLASGDKKAAYRFGASTLKGLSIKKLRETVCQAMIEEGCRITTTELLGRSINRGIALRGHVIRLAKKLEASGIRVYVVSASPEPIVRTTMQYFGLDCELIGVKNVLQDDQDGQGGDDRIITGAVRHPLSIYEGKVGCIKCYIDPDARPLLGVGDSINDLPMLNYAQLRAVVDRGNELAGIARAQGWFILDGQPAINQ